MSVERQHFMVARKDMGAKQRRTPNQAYQTRS